MNLKVELPLIFYTSAIYQEHVLKKRLRSFLPPERLHIDELTNKAGNLHGFFFQPPQQDQYQFVFTASGNDVFLTKRLLRYSGRMEEWHALGKAWRAGRHGEIDLSNPNELLPFAEVVRLHGADAAQSACREIVETTAPEQPSLIEQAAHSIASTFGLTEQKVGIVAEDGSIVEIPGAQMAHGVALPVPNPSTATAVAGAGYVAYELGKDPSLQQSIASGLAYAKDKVFDGVEYAMDKAAEAVESVASWAGGLQPIRVIENRSDAFNQDLTLIKKQIDGRLPHNPDELLNDQNWEETTHPRAQEKGHRTFENNETGEKLRYDEGKPGEAGHRGESHWHRFNPDSESKRDKFLDADDNPVPEHSDDSHLYPWAC